MNFNSVIDRALSEHTGSGIYNKKSNGKYSLWLPVTNTGELGSAPEQIEKTVIGNMARSYIQGRKDMPQQTLTVYNHRDNQRILKKYENETVEFLRVFPDFSGVKYSGQVNKTFTDTTLDNAEQMDVSVTITVPEEVIDDCFDLIEDTAVFTNDIPSVVFLDSTSNTTKKINVVTDPANATIKSVSETTDVATVEDSGKDVTITAVKKGTSVVTITTSADGYASWTRTILVVVDSDKK